MRAALWSAAFALAACLDELHDLARTHADSRVEMYRHAVIPVARPRVRRGFTNLHLAAVIAIGTGTGGLVGRYAPIMAFGLGVLATTAVTLVFVATVDD